jgi:hypothetical protein
MLLKFSKKAFLERNSFVLIVTRPGSSTATSSFPGNANLASVDITDAIALASVLRTNDSEVVISAIGIAGLSTQYIQGDAAKAAGVKLFVPSEFGFPSIGREEGPMHLKDTIAGKEENILCRTLSYNLIFFVKQGISNP